jgi:hypothetical protein
MWFTYRILNDQPESNNILFSTESNANNYINENGGPAGFAAPIEDMISETNHVAKCYNPMLSDKYSRGRYKLCLTCSTFVLP